MQAYYQLTTEQKLALSNEEIHDAIKIEAISRNIKPPIPLSEALSRSEWRGYQSPAESIRVWELNIHNYSHSGIGYLDEELAKRALQGLVKIEHGYKDTPRLKTAEPSLTVVHIGKAPSVNKAAKFEDYAQDDSTFDKLCQECLDDLGTLRQAAYDARVRAERKVEYLRLAQGNEEIAKGFWAKAERTEWPA